MTEGFPLVDVAEMHLHRRQSHGLQRVQNGYAGVGVGGGVDDDAVRLAQRALDDVHQHALMVGLKALHFDAFPGADLPDKRFQIGKGLPTINIRLPNAQQVQVWTVQDKQFHIFPPLRAGFLAAAQAGAFRSPLVILLAIQKDRLLHLRSVCCAHGFF